MTSRSPRTFATSWEYLENASETSSRTSKKEREGKHSIVGHATCSYKFCDHLGMQVLALRPNLASHQPTTYSLGAPRPTPANDGL